MEADSRLLDAVCKSDRSAYTSLFLRYYERLVLFAFSYTRDREVSEDIVQHFFYRLWENRKALGEVNDCKTYFYTAVKNRSVNYLRDKKITSANIPDKADDDNILQAIMEEEVYTELIQKIRQLPPQCQKVILLKLEGMDNREIASRCGITEESVRSQIRRGKELLRKQWKSSPFLALLFVLMGG